MNAAETLREVGANGELHRDSSPQLDKTASEAADRAERVRFGSADARARLGGAGTMVVRFERLTSAARGHLAEVFDDAMERELAARGATSPGMGSSADPDTALSDQLFRARQVGVYRVIVAFGPLAPLCSGSGSRTGALEAEDAASLLFLAQATTERPIELFLDSSDEHTGIFVTPVPLKDILGGRWRENPPATARSIAPIGEDVVKATVHAAIERPVAERIEIAAERPLEKPIEKVSEKPIERPVEKAVEKATTKAEVTDKHTAGLPIADDASARHWALALHAAKGPQPLPNFEKLFRESYVPLCEAVDRGHPDPRAVHARDEFRATFTRMYLEACPTFAVTGKRPKMVFDAPDVAAKLGRSHGARAVRLLLVSAMRYDVGLYVERKLSESGLPVLGPTILWSALPTTTARQLDCLSRGLEALRGPPASEKGLETARGRTIDAIRRVKIGSRDVFQLDACEARMREAGKGASKALVPVAHGLAESIAKHLSTLAPKTLLFVFGDHGVTFDGSGVARAGGASPEEVLVPAFALMVAEQATPREG